MRADGAPPGQDPPVEGEILHVSERTRVTRLTVDGRAVIRKEPLGPDAPGRLSHEAAMLERLRGAEGIAQLVAAPDLPGSLVLADAGDRSLAELAKPLPTDDLISLATALARAVAGMHRREVIHCDIAPANIVLSPAGAPCLVDFELATSLAGMRPEFTPDSEIVGTLAYLAPEQTGRTGRPVDQRADLYALGATLYELATGEPPFGAADPLRLIHDHLARVPVPPDQANPAVPAYLSEIIMHLLEKEPGHRYQTADGMVHDLEQLAQGRAHPPAGALRIGERDFPLRLVAPSRLVGREDEVAALAQALEAARAGRCRGVLISGAPGVGKTALADELRPVITSQDGWLVAGKFDARRRDLEFDGIYQALRALARLLLAGPEDDLATVRGRILAAASPNAGLLTAVMPEFGALLAVPSDPGDPLTAQLRAQRAAVAVLRAVASPERPVVMFVDDLQWAGRTPLGVVDLVLSEQPSEGLLLVGAYRDGEVDATHPLTPLLARWRDQPGVAHLRLASLPGRDLVTLVAQMLQVDRAVAQGLATVIEPHARGNPYETIELLNALRRDGLLTSTTTGWRWEDAVVRAHLSQADMAGLLAAQVDSMPVASRQVVEAMACLGGRAGLSLLAAATGEPPGALGRALAPAVEEGLLVAEPGADQPVRFRHDRILEVTLAAMDPPRRRNLQLAMARRLAAVPGLFAVAAEQYLPVADAVEDTTERPRVVELLRRAAGQARLIGDYALVNTLLATALPLIDPRDTATLAQVRTSRHAALYCLGRLEEADEEYQIIEGLCPAVLQRAGATAVQVLSLTHRTRFAEAIGLGIGSLDEMGISVPAADQLPAEVDRQFGYLHRWLEDTDAAAELARPEITDPGLIAVARVINAVLPASYVADPGRLAWLSLEGLRIWLEHGPQSSLIGPVSHTAFVALMLRGDYATASRAMQRVLALGEARGYEPGTSQARFLHATAACWSMPLEDAVQHGRRAREGLISGGDLAYAGYTYFPTVYYLLDFAPSLDVWVAEVEAGLAFAQRTGNDEASGWLGCCRWLAGVLRGDSAAARGEARPGDSYTGDPLTLLHEHITAAIAAALFGDAAGLAQHTEAAMPLLPAARVFYTTAVARLLRGLALAGQARGVDGEERDRLLAELDEVTHWLAARAADAPGNFLPMLRLAEAERAWSAGDFRAAVMAFDAAQREVAARQRPWHQALITERAARFYLSHGAEHAGHGLLAQARQHYAAWGATAKVEQMDWAYPFLRRQPGAATAHGGDLSYRHAAVTAGAVDLLGIVSASQALSSQTSIERLRSRVVEVLSAMTGATGVRLLLWSEDQHGWLLPAAQAGGGTVPVSGTGHDRAVPTSVLRYVRRTRETLVVADAAGDDRFARDPYFAGVDGCSLLAVPILSRGTLRAALLLENRLIRSAFTAERLDAVKLIAGQLATSLDNAQLYAEFRQVADEQAALRRVAILVAQAAAPEGVFAAVTVEAGRLLGVDAALLVRYDPRDTITVVGSWTSTDTAPPTPVGSRLPLGGHNITTLVLRTGQAERIDYAGLPGGMSGVIGDDATGDWGWRAAMGVPIRGEGRLWGVMIVGLTREGQSLPADGEKRLAGFTELVATAIANTQARVELQDSADEQAALRRVAELVARSAPPQEVLAAVTDEAGLLLKVDYMVLSRYDPDGLVTVVGVWTSTGPSRPLPIGLRLKAEGLNVHALVAETGRSARIDDYDAATGGFSDVARDWEFRASVGVPIWVEGQLWGVMSAGSRSEPLPPGTEARLGGFTGLVATAIANTQARSELQDSAGEQAALRRVAELVARSAPPQEVLDAVTEEAGRLLHGHHAWMTRYDGDGARTVVASWGSTGVTIPVGGRARLWGRNVSTLVFQTGQPARIDDYADASGPAADVAHEIGLRAAVAVPLSVEGRLWGAMSVGSGVEPMPASTEERLAGFTGLVATAIANAEAQAALAASRARVVAAADQERRRIERDLHDGTQQRLVSLALQLRALQAALPSEPSTLAAELDRSVAEITGALEDLRETARGIHPAILAEGGLRLALRALARRCPIPVKLTVHASGRLPESIEVSAYYVVAEALTNAAKHGRASAVSVEAEVAGGTVSVAVRDDGVGGADFTRGTGLAGLRDRVEAIGGRIFLDSPPGAGTTLRVEFPV
jgi:GAF domain-containing protein